MASTYLSAATAAVADRFVASANMKVGAYTIANAAPAIAGGRLVTITHTADGNADTLGTVVIVGKDLHGNVLTETITPASGTVATGTKVFASVTSATGAGWVIDGNNDTLTIGHAAASILAVGGGQLEKVILGETAAGTITIADKSGTLAVLKASVVEGEYAFGIPWTGFLSVTVAAASKVTVVHSPGQPLVYAMA